ncbi:MAG: polyprenyl synthetase family protein [Gemmatimonadales bacterium]
MATDTAPQSLAAIHRPVRAELDATVEELGRIVRNDFPLIGGVNAHLLRLRGKLFRPALLLLAARATGTMDQRKVRLAAVVELIHLATLVHDDSVDHSVLRRGQPTVNALFSHQVAVIMGDYLYSRAIQQLVELQEWEPMQVMSRVTNEMTVGEMRQLEAHDRLAYGLESYERLIRAKTASLVSAACELGGIDAGASLRATLLRFGHGLGMAFQITDDVLDYTETEDVTGKPSGHDLKEHKITLPLIAALPELDAAERATVDALMDDADPSDERVAEVIAIVQARGGVESARERAQGFARAAERELEALSEGEARDALLAALAYAVERRH